MLLLIDILKVNGTIRFENEFCDAIGIRKQNLWKIRQDLSHFTAGHIENTIMIYKVDANWLFGIGDRIFFDLKTKNESAQTRAQKIV